jgi:hypothetical protein
MDIDFQLDLAVQVWTVTLSLKTTSIDKAQMNAGTRTGYAQMKRETLGQ